MDRDIRVGPGKLTNRGIYANKNFKKGDLVGKWNLTKLSQEQFNRLPKSEQIFTHSFFGQIYLFAEPHRYTNHSSSPNSVSNFKEFCSYALRDIKKGEMITVNTTSEYKFEVRSFLEVNEYHALEEFNWMSGGYRNAEVEYKINGKIKRVKLKRAGNWHILQEKPSK